MAMIRKFSWAFVKDMVGFICLVFISGIVGNKINFRLLFMVYDKEYLIRR